MAPNTCVCEEGFERNANGKCAEVCDRECQLGWCEENECRCHEGYAPEEVAGGGDMRCVAQCDEPCQNGQCVQPNVCRCEAGEFSGMVNMQNVIYRVVLLKLRIFIKV